MFAFALVNISAWIFIIPAALIFNRSSQNWIWDSIPKEGKKRLRKIWARNAREIQNLKTAQLQSTPVHGVVLDEE